MKLNKGEWSEVYVFLKLLAEGKLYAADKDLKKIEGGSKRKPQIFPKIFK